MRRLPRSARSVIQSGPHGSRALNITSPAGFALHGPRGAGPRRAHLPDHGVTVVPGQSAAAVPHAAGPHRTGDRERSARGGPGGAGRRRRPRERQGAPARRRAAGDEPAVPVPARDDGHRAAGRPRLGVRGCGHGLGDGRRQVRVHPRAARPDPRDGRLGDGPGRSGGSTSRTTPVGAARSTRAARCSAGYATSTPAPSTSWSSRTR
jgi:hypothetical protein